MRDFGVKLLNRVDIQKIFFHYPLHTFYKLFFLWNLVFNRFDSAKLTLSNFNQIAALQPGVEHLNSFPLPLCLALR